MSEPISPPPLKDFRPEFIPAYLSNGLIGLRVGRIPLIEGLTMLNGLAGVHPEDQVEGFARAPYVVAGDIAIDRVKLSERSERARFIEQRYDFSCGELVSRFAFEVGDVRADVESLVLCSRTQPTVVIHELRVSVNGPCELSIAMGIDPIGIEGRWRKRETDTPGAKEPIVDGSLLWETYGGLGSCGAAYVTRFEGPEDAKREREENDRLAPLHTVYSLRARSGATCVVRSIASVVADQMHAEPHRQAARLAAVGAKLGFDRLRKENREAWADLWRGRVILSGAGRRWQELADAAFYYLHASAHGSSLFSTSMFGLAYWPNYHYYRGQVMWDIESFVFPPLAVTDPHAADALLQYRPDRLRRARRHAALNGHRGLQLPWANGIILNHDRFTPDERGVTGATPEALAALFPVGYVVAPETERATIEFYLERIDDFIGHPMLSALLGVYAAWIGERERSLDLFERGYAEFVNEPF